MRLKDKAGNIVKSIVGIAIHFIDKAVNEAISEEPEIITMATVDLSKNIVRVTDDMHEDRHNQLNLRDLPSLHNTDFSYVTFVSSRAFPQQTDITGFCGIFYAICENLLAWSVKVIASFGVFCDINKDIQEAENRANEKMDSVTRHFDIIVKEEFTDFIHQQMCDSRAGYLMLFA